MPLTTAQATTLKAAILSETDQAFVALRTANNEDGMRDWLNTRSTFVVWKTYVTQDEIMQNGFDWVRVDNLSVGKARIWEWLFDNAQAAISPSKDNVRAGIAECWKGTAADLAVQAAVLTHCRRACTRGERYFASGTGTEATPGKLGIFEGLLSAQDISDALRA